MAPKRQVRITILIVAFAMQIPALIGMWISGVDPSYSVLVTLLPMTALAFILLARRND